MDYLALTCFIIFMAIPIIYVLVRQPKNNDPDFGNVVSEGYGLLYIDFLRDDVREAQISSSRRKVTECLAKLEEKERFLKSMASGGKEPWKSSAAAKLPEIQNLVKQVQLKLRNMPK